MNRMGRFLCKGLRYLMDGMISRDDVRGVVEKTRSTAK